MEQGALKCAVESICIEVLFKSVAIKSSRLYTYHATQVVKFENIGYDSFDVFGAG